MENSMVMENIKNIVEQFFKDIGKTEDTMDLGR